MRIRSVYISPAELAKKFARQREQAKDEKQARQLRKVIGRLRPRKGERGKVVFIGKDGQRLQGNGKRVGYAVYIDRRGKKQVVRGYDRVKHRVERVAKARRLSEIDISRVRSKRAKREFLRAHSHELARGITPAQSRYGYRRNFRRIDAQSQFTEFAARELLKILRSQQSLERNLALQIGIYCDTPNGAEFFETQIDALPGDLRKAKIETLSLERIKTFFGRQVYAFIAAELSARGFVMSGSAQFVQRLPENQGKARARWTKGGHHWQGIGKAEVQIKSVEWRFLQLTFSAA